MWWFWQQEIKQSKGNTSASSSDVCDAEKWMGRGEKQDELLDLIKDLQLGPTFT